MQFQFQISHFRDVLLSIIHLSFLLAQKSSTVLCYKN